MSYGYPVLPYYWLAKYSCFVDDGLLTHEELWNLMKKRYNSVFGVPKSGV